MKFFHTHPEYLRLVRPMAERPLDDHSLLRLVLADWLEENAPSDLYQNDYHPWLFRANRLRSKTQTGMGMSLGGMLEFLNEWDGRCPIRHGAMERSGTITQVSVHGLTGWHEVLDSGVFSRHPIRKIDVFSVRPTSGGARWNRCNWHQHDVSAGVWAKLSGTSGTNSQRKWYAGQKAAVADLERALLAYAREQACLPPLEQPAFRKAVLKLAL